MNDYLERNKALIDEIGRLKSLRRGKVIGKSSSGTTTTNLGSYESSYLEKTVYLAVKQNPNFNYEDRVAWDLAIIVAIADKCPKLYPELPIVYGILRNGQGKDIGVLTEDFSEGGKFPPEGVTKRGFMMIFPGAPHELKGIVVNHNIDDYDLASSAFLVNGQRRLGDFNNLKQGLEVNELLARFPFAEISGNLSEHRVTIDYEI